MQPVKWRLLPCVKATEVGGGEGGVGAEGTSGGHGLSPGHSRVGIRSGGSAGDVRRLGTSGTGRGNRGRRGDIGVQLNVGVAVKRAIDELRVQSLGNAHVGEIDVLKDRT